MDFISDIFSTLKEMFADNFAIGITITIVGIFLVLLILLLIVLALFGIFRAFDSWFAQKTESDGLIINKEFRKGFYVQHGYYPDTYLITINILGQRETKETSQKDYQSLSINDKVKVRYVIGRFSGEIYILNLERSSGLAT